MKDGLSPACGFSDQKMIPLKCDQSIQSDYLRIQNLLSTVSSQHQRQRHSQSSSAPDFNLFSILKVEGAEVSTHSAFLANLLDPSGTHAQGDLFLRAFLREIGSAELASYEDWTVSRDCLLLVAAWTLYFDQPKPGPSL
jgi:hypothetical protein